MNKTRLAALVLGVCTAGLAVAATLLLPATVVTQIALGGSASTMPKALAVGLPVLLGVGGAVGAWLAAADRDAVKRSLLVSAVGVFVLVLELVVNL